MRKTISISTLLVIFLFCLYFRGKTQNCYQSYLKSEPIHEIKYLGIFKNLRLYREILSFNNGGGTSLNIILLRTDTNHIKNYDLCFDMEGGFQTQVFKTEQNQVDVTYTINDVTSIYQILYAGLNYARLDTKGTNLFFKGSTLLLQYVEGSCISNCPYYKVVEKYKFKNGLFKLVNRGRKKLSS